MNRIYQGSLGLALVLGISSAAQALHQSGAGAGYYGSAQYDGNAGGVVGPYSTWFACNQALQSMLYNAVNLHNHTIVSVTPCSYRSNILVAHEIHVRLGAGSPGESLGASKIVLEEISRVRDEFRADDYEAALGAVAEASGGK